MTAPLPATPAGTFDDLGLHPDLLAAIERIGFQHPTEIQTELIPIALAGTDCLGQAKTGTGKTAAFALPMIQHIETGGGFQAIVLVPTRELAAQVDSHVRQFTSAKALRTALVYGGRRISQQMDALKKNPEIVIGTPGRILDLMRRKVLNISGAKLAVLDEVDRMLDIGFRDDIRKILQTIKSRHQTIFVSATIDDEIRKLAHTFMNDPVELNVSHDTMTVDGIEQGYVTIDPRDKTKTLLGFLKHEAPALAIVFTNTKHQARRLAERLKKAGVNCKEIHGDLMQSRREKVMKSFRASHIQVLVATDLASRGLDVMEVSHIVNFDMPEDPSVYVHRVGRTARMGNSGYAVSFVSREQGKLLTDVEKLINMELPCFDEKWVVSRAPEPEPEKAKKDLTGTGRLNEPLRRDAELESSGLALPPRTLGSRFPLSRRRRLRR